MAVFVCPQCSEKRLREHCLTCNWLFCSKCFLIIGPHNSIYIGSAKKRVEDAENRRNGI